MANDTSLQLRQAVVSVMRASDELTAIVPADRNYGMRAPATLTWPFTRYGSPDALPFRGQCLDGARIGFTVHAFSKAQYEDECANINSVVSASLDGKVLELDGPGGAKAHIVWQGSQIIPDAAEAAAWHGVNRFEATVVS
jgi:hypothetical protein